MKREVRASILALTVIYFRNLLLPILKGEKTILKLIILVGILGFINVLFIIADFRDYSNLYKAKEYEIPSILYGTKDGVFEPIAEFSKFSRIVYKLSEFQEEKENIQDKRNKVLQCFLSTEDNEFYSHLGLDFRGILRAAFVNVLAGKVKEGASTITQQVARLKFLSTERSFMRKAREAWLAMLMEAFYSKNTILEIYLNEIPLGHGTLGVGAASRFYFRKNINELSWGEASLLASLTTRPKEFSPLQNPNTSSKKVRIVFLKLIENGRLDVKKAEKEYKDFSEYYINLNRSPNDSAFADRLNRYPYFTEYVRRSLMKLVSLEQLYTGGLKIYSTLNVQHQEAAEITLNEGLMEQTLKSNQKAFTDIDAFDNKYGDIYNLLADLNDIPDFKFKITKLERSFRSYYQEFLRDNLSALNFLTGIEEVGEVIEENFNTQNKQQNLLPIEGSIISMRPNSGYITAIVGGSGFRSDNQHIRSTQALRQPGSSFKPLIYSAAIDYYSKNSDEENNITASTLFLDSPIQYILEDGGEWNPENYSSEYSGFITLRKALESSKNSVAVRVVEHIGLTNLLPYLDQFLHTSKEREIPKNFSVGLGTYEVTPLELTRAYAMIASGGIDVDPISILYITDKDGKIISDYRDETKEHKRIISKEASFIITSMMEDVVKKGTGRATISYGLRQPVSGKTGTTNNFRDAWFVGFTPQLVSSVWLGYDIGTLSLGWGMSGGVVAAPLWGKYMAKAMKGEPIQQFPSLGNLDIEVRKVCSISGKLPGGACKKVYGEYFIKGTTPTQVCNDHSSYFEFDEPKLKEDEDNIKIKTPSKKNKRRKNIFNGDD